MKLGCSHQSELTEAVRAGQWPDDCDPVLRAHVAACRSCNDFVLMSEVFRQSRASTAQQAPVGSPGTLWWSAQVRRRNRAVGQMAMPIVLAEVTALVCTVAALVFSLWRWNQVTNWFASITAPFQSQPDAAASAWPALLVVGGLAMLLLLGSIAVYLIATQD